jgi:hypothetical protein
MILHFKKPETDSRYEDVYLDYINLKTLSQAVKADDLEDSKNREPLRFADWRLPNEQSICL